MSAVNTVKCAERQNRPTHGQVPARAGRSGEERDQVFRLDDAQFFPREAPVRGGKAPRVRGSVRPASRRCRGVRRHLPRAFGCTCRANIPRALPSRAARNESKKTNRSKSAEARAESQALARIVVVRFALIFQRGVKRRGLLSLADKRGQDFGEPPARDTGERLFVEDFPFEIARGGLAAELGAEPIFFFKPEKRILLARRRADQNHEKAAGQRDPACRNAPRVWRPACASPDGRNQTT